MATAKLTASHNDSSLNFKKATTMRNTKPAKVFVTKVDADTGGYESGGYNPITHEAFAQGEYIHLGYLTGTKSLNSEFTDMEVKDDSTRKVISEKNLQSYTLQVNMLDTMLARSFVSNNQNEVFRIICDLGSDRDGNNEYMAIATASVSSENLHNPSEDGFESVSVSFKSMPCPRNILIDYEDFSILFGGIGNPGDGTPIYTSGTELTFDVKSYMKKPSSAIAPGNTATIVSNGSWGGNRSVTAIYVPAELHIGGVSGSFNLVEVPTDVALPDAPAISAPTNNAADVSITPTLTLSAAVTGAAYYRYLITTMDDAIVVNKESSATSTSISATDVRDGSALSNNTKYKLTVYAGNIAGETPSTLLTFTTQSAT